MKDLTKLPKKIREFIEKNNLNISSDGSYWTDGYLVVAKKDNYVKMYIHLIQDLIKRKKEGKLEELQYGSEHIIKLKEMVLKDPINDFQILLDMRDYIVFTDTTSQEGV